MRHAMMMTVHTNFHILQKFVDLFDDERYDFYILVDKKTKASNEEIIAQMPKNSTLVFLPRINIYWAGYRQIEAYLRLIGTASKKNYDYYHFFQGSDFPLKTKDDVDDFFRRNHGYEFVNIEQKEFAKFKCGYWHFFANNRFYRSNRLVKAMNFSCVTLQKLLGVRRNKDIELYHGSALTSLSHACVSYLLSIEEEIRKRFRYSLAADEVFLQTMIARSAFRARIYRFENSSHANCRLIDWERRNKNSPYTFVTNDLEELLHAEEDLLFARKFDEHTDIQVVEKLYEYLKKCGSGEK